MTGLPTGSGCGCGGLADSTPVEVMNRPGLPAIAYRTGTYATFRASMLAGLTRASRPALAELRTREEDDFSIALIDAWAVAADVLTFYTERIANEHYLGTATERRSVADIAALIGYRLDPGVAAQTWMAITLETAPGAPPESLIPAGSRMQTLPGPGEVPQAFETIEAVTAVGTWNRPQVRLLEPRTPQTGDTEVLLAGATAAVRRGDRLLFVADDWTSTSQRWQVVRVVEVAPDAVGQVTAVRFAPALTGLDLLPGSGVSVHALRAQAALFGFNAPNPLLLEATILAALKAAGLVDAGGEWQFAAITGQEVLLDGLHEGVEPGGWAVLTAGDVTALAPVDSVRETANSAYAVSARVSALHLDRSDDDLAPFGGAATRGTIVTFRSERLPLAQVRVTTPLSGASIPLAAALPSRGEPRRVLVRGARPRAGRGPGTLVDGQWPDRDGHAGGAPVRGGPVGDPAPIVVAVDADILPGLVRWTLRPAVGGDDVTVLGTPDALVYLPAEPRDELIGEVVTVAPAATPAHPIPGPILELALVEPLVNVYDRTGPVPVDLFGNVADATHGQAVLGEVLGSGDGGRVFQRFTLKGSPLTHVQAVTPSGGQSTLAVRVNGVLWHEVPTLFGAGGRDRVYVSAIDDSGATTITFGDGITGARLPTGVENVVATYRTGLGLAGAARADQVTLPLTRPLGLKSVTNPLPAGGAQDRQVTDDARTNAPRSVLTLGRVVSLQDYADFAADFSGVGKATATWTWDGQRRGVLVTVAAADGRPIPAAVPLLQNLRAALLAAGDPQVRLNVCDFRPAGFALLATLRVAADHEPDTVRAATSAALLARYSFANRDFGQGVALSEVVQAAHEVPGVAALRVDRLHREDQPAHLADLLVAAAPRAGGPPGVAGAEILTLSADLLKLEVGW